MKKEYQKPDHFRAFPIRINRLIGEAHQRGEHSRVYRLRRLKLAMVWQEVGRNA
jgi:hypothetical protein